LYKRTLNVVKRHNEAEAKKAGKSPNKDSKASKCGKESTTNEAQGKNSPNKEQTYNLYGFVWAHKVTTLFYNMFRHL
jgi:hypothetical protein